MLIVSEDVLALHALEDAVDLEGQRRGVATHLLGDDPRLIDWVAMPGSVIVVDCGKRSMVHCTSIAMIGTAYPEASIVALVNKPSEPELRSLWHAGARSIVARSEDLDSIRNAIAAARCGLTVFSAATLSHFTPAVSKAENTIAPDAPQVLTRRETEVVRLLCAGRSNQGIAHELRIAESTVKTHLAHVMAKWDSKDRVEVALHAVRTGLASFHP